MNFIITKNLAINLAVKIKNEKGRAFTRDLFR